MFDIVHILFCQVAIRKKYGIANEHGYITASSSADNGGHGGCMVVVSAPLPFSDAIEGSILTEKVTSNDVNILYSDHRPIIVRISAPCFQAACISIDGLDFDHGCEEITAAWKDLGDTIAKCIK